MTSRTIKNAAMMLQRRRQLCFSLGERDRDDHPASGGEQEEGPSVLAQRGDQDHEDDLMMMARPPGG